LLSVGENVRPDRVGSRVAGLAGVDAGTRVVVTADRRGEAANARRTHVAAIDRVERIGNQVETVGVDVVVVGRRASGDGEAAGGGQGWRDGEVLVGLNADALE